MTKHSFFAVIQSSTVKRPVTNCNRFLYSQRASLEVAC